MKVLVTGATGFVGRPLCFDLAGKGHEVVALTRRVDSFGPGVSSVSGADLISFRQWDVLDDCDAVVHLAAHVHRIRLSAADRRLFRQINVDATARLVEEASARGVRRFVFLSTVKVHGESSGRDPFVEASPIAPMDDYARSKAEAEVLVRAGGLPNFILRPPLVYGPGVGANFLRLLHAIAKQRPLPLASIDNRRSLVYVGNLVEAISRCLVTDLESSATFLVSDGESVSSPVLAGKIAAALGVKSRLVPVPVGLLKLGGFLLGRGPAVSRLVGSLEVDDSAIRGQLGWVPRFTLDDGLKQTADWFRSEVAR